MKTILLLLFLVFSTHGYIDENALATLQTLDHWNTFRVVLPHAINECFYVEAKLNDTIHVIYQVLKGGNGLVRVSILDPLDKQAYFQFASAFGWYDEERSSASGIYKICFQNDQYFTNKIVYIGVLAVHHDRLWEGSIEAVKEKQNNETAFVEEFSTRILTLANAISHTLYRVTAQQTVARVHFAYDLYWVEANASYVQNWALCQMITMILCSMIQVFTIRQLFKPSSSSRKTSASKSYGENRFSQTSSHFIMAN